MTYIPASQNMLADMLRYTRPAYSVAEKSFIRRYLKPLNMGSDKAGNLFKVIGNADILWSCHTDTVHRESGRQTVLIKDGVATSSSKDCLGADCTTGVFVMRNMIENNIPGLYLFHAAEENGRVGSRWLAKNRAKDLAKYKFAIAFDRKGFSDIITHQMSSRCCSEDFSKSLAAQLNECYTTPFNERYISKYKSSSNGSYTDTASYTDLIGECTNISVGYNAQHTQFESQDVDFAIRLAERMCKLDISKLVSKRAPGEVDKEDYSYSRYYAKPYKRMAPTTLYGLVNDEPWYATKVLEGLGVTFEDLSEYVKNEKRKYLPYGYEGYGS